MENNMKQIEFHLRIDVSVDYSHLHNRMTAR